MVLLRTIIDTFEMPHDVLFLPLNSFEMIHRSSRHSKLNPSLANRQGNIRNPIYRHECQLNNTYFLLHMHPMFTQLVIIRNDDNSIGPIPQSLSAFLSIYPIPYQNTNMIIVFIIIMLLLLLFISKMSFISECYIFIIILLQFGMIVCCRDELPCTFIVIYAFRTESVKTIKFIIFTNQLYGLKFSYSIQLYVEILSYLYICIWYTQIYVIYSSLTNSEIMGSPKNLETKRLLN